MSQYFRDCTKAPSNRRTLFTAPFDQKIVDELTEEDPIEVHPAILKFKHSLKKDAKGVGYRSTSKIGKTDYENLSDIRYENATNPALNKAVIFKTVWTKETLRDFCSNRHLYQVNDDENETYSRIGDDFTNANVPLKAKNQEEGKAITVGDVLESIIVDFEIHPDYQRHGPQWNSADSFVEQMRDSGKIPEQIKEDGGWGTPFSWPDHFGREEQEKCLEQLSRE